MKLDLLAVSVHPDDAELGCGGTLIKQKMLGYKTGVLDLTRGELGTRGTPEIRTEEAMNASRIMELDVREQLSLEDGFFQNDKASQLEIIKMLRKYQPDVVLGNAPEDRHPDHGRASKLIYDACFLSGLPQIKTELDGQSQEAWRPKALYYYIQGRYIEPDFVIDVTKQYDKKMEAIMAFKSQFFNPDNGEPETFISSPQFLDTVTGKMLEFGMMNGYKYAEGFIKSSRIGVKDLFDLD